MDCKNCKQTLLENQNFCSSCGAKVIRNRLNFKNLWTEFVERYLNFDNTFFRTIKHLFTRPEDVILGYINGQRKRYVNPISLYAIALTTTGILFFLIGKFFVDQLSMEWLFGELGQVGEESFKAAVENQTLFSLISIPIYALMSKLVFLGYKKLNLTEHAIIYFYCMGATSIVSFPFMVVLLILGVNYFAMVYAFMLVVIVYVAWCLKRIFNLSIGSIVLRTILFFVILFFVMILIGIAQLAFAYLTGGIEGIKAMGKPK